MSGSLPCFVSQIQPVCMSQVSNERSFVTGCVTMRTCDTNGKSFDFGNRNEVCFSGGGSIGNSERSANVSVSGARSRNQRVMAEVSILRGMDRPNPGNGTMRVIAESHSFLGSTLGSAKRWHCVQSFRSSASSSGDLISFKVLETAVVTLDVGWEVDSQPDNASILNKQTLAVARCHGKRSGLTAVQRLRNCWQMFLFISLIRRMPPSGNDPSLLDAVR